jgi:hypothetical protein
MSSPLTSIPIQSPKCAIFKTAPLPRRVSFSGFRWSAGGDLSGGLVWDDGDGRREVGPGFLSDGGGDDVECVDKDWEGARERGRDFGCGKRRGRGEWSRTARRAVDEPSRRGLGFVGFGFVDVEGGESGVGHDEVGVRD